MARSLCLALPADSPWSGRSASLHWLVRTGDKLDTGQLIARLIGVETIDVRAPTGVRGTLRALLVHEGARVTAGNPLLTFLPDNDGEGRSDAGSELAEETASFAQPSERSVIAEVSDMKRVRSIAVVGLIVLLGLATTVVAQIYFLFVGGLAPLLVGAVALSVAAMSLLYGQQQLHAHDRRSG